MSWLARLKNTRTPETDATKPTKPGYVGFVASKLQEYEKTSGTASNGHNRGTWPYSDAWNELEIDQFHARLALLTDRRMSLHTAEDIAEQLLQRDRDQDERSLCLECRFFLRGRCSNWHTAGMANKHCSELGRCYPLMLKRCPGFEPVIPPARQDNAP